MTRPRPGGATPASRVLALAVLAALSTGCGAQTAAVGRAEPSAGVPGPSSPAVPSPTASPVPAGAPPLSPLLGLPAASPEQASRPIVGVPVQTGTGRPPPVGLDRADVVYVSVVNPGRQRSVALFQSQDAGRVGPVADTRPMDGRLLDVTGGVVQHRGGTAGFVRRTDNSEVPQFSAVVHPGAFSRDADGSTYADTAPARAAEGAAPALVGLMAFRAAPGDTPAPGPVTVAMPDQPRLELTYDPASGLWSGALGSVPVRATNVVVQQVDYGRVDLPGTPATEADPVLTGDGAAVVLSGPTVLDGTWNRPGRKVLTSYVAADGTPIRLLPGVTFVVLTPRGTPVTR